MLNQNDRKEVQSLVKGINSEKFVLFALVAIIAFLAEPVRDMVFGQDDRTAQAIAEVRAEVNQNSLEMNHTLKSLQKTLNSLDISLAGLKVGQDSFKSEVRRNIESLVKEEGNVRNRLQEIERSHWSAADDLKEMSPLKEEVARKADQKEIMILQKQIDWLLNKSMGRVESPPFTNQE